MTKKTLHYIGIFLILFGSSLSLLSVYTPIQSNADDNEEDIKRISDEIKEDIRDYNDLLDRATEESTYCHEIPEKDYSEMSLLSYIETTSVDQHTCLKEISYNIEKIKKEKEISQVIKTYHMLDTKLSAINETMEHALDLSKETNQNRKGYSM